MFYKLYNSLEEIPTKVRNLRTVNIGGMNTASDFRGKNPTVVSVQSIHSYIFGQIMSGIDFSDWTGGYLKDLDLGVLKKQIYSIPLESLYGKILVFNQLNTIGNFGFIKMEYNG